MSEETYELCLDGEDLRIIPVGDEQVSVQILSEDATDGILTDLAGQEDGLDKTFSSPLFLSNSQTLMVPPSVDLKQSLQKKTILESISLYIEYGKDWIEDVLNGLSELQGFCDFPIYCADGISWSNKLILGSLSCKLRSLLSAAGQDSCLIVPQLTKSEFDTFNACILNKSIPITKDTMKVLLKVGEFFEFPIRYISLDNNNNTDGLVNYSTIFTQQREEFIHKISWQADLAKFISKVAESPLSSVHHHHKAENWQQIQTEPFMKGEPQVNDDRIECVDCGRFLPSDEALQTHVDIVHSLNQNKIRKKFKCPLCPKLFSFKPNIGKHVKLVHRRRLEEVILGSVSPAPLSPAPFDLVVDLAPSSLVSPSGSLVAPRGALITTRGRPPRQQKKPKLLVGPADSRCNLCGQSCKNKRALVQHMQVHYGRVYKCEVDGCKAGFTEKSKLRRHMVVHTGERNFACDICGSKFTLRHNLKTHLRTHDNDGVRRGRKREVLAIDEVLVAQLAKEEMAKSARLDVVDVDVEPVDLSETTDDIEKFIAAMEGEAAH